MRGLFTVCLATLAAIAFSQMRITEFMYNGSEFVEFTNVGGTAIDMTGWSFDDDSQTPGGTDLSGFGIVGAGQSVILSEVSALAFIAEWSLLPAVQVVGDNLVNLGRNDEINLFDSGGVLVDRLTFGDQTFPGTIRANGVSGNTDPSNYGANNVAGWVLSAVGDGFGSYTSASGFIGNPGTAPVPEPATLLALALGAAALARRKRS